jgi:hypothetical protein
LEGSERRFTEWIGNLAKIDGAVEKTTLRELLRTFEAVHMGKSESTQENNGYIICKFKSWRHGTNIEVRDIRPSHLDDCWRPFGGCPRTTEQAFEWTAEFLWPRLRGHSVQLQQSR